MASLGKWDSTLNNTEDQQTIGQGGAGNSAFMNLLGGKFNQVLPALGNNFNQLGQRLQESNKPWGQLTPGQQQSSINDTLGFAIPGAGGEVKESLGGVKGLMGYLTQKGLLSKYSEAKAQSLADGIFKSWGDLQQDATQSLSEGANRFRPDLAKEVQSIFSKRTPALTTTSEEIPDYGRYQYLKKADFNADDLHDFRQALDKGIPQNAWQNPNSRPIGVEANQFVRGVVSNALHEVAPKTKLLDSLYSAYSNPLIKGGKVPFVNTKLEYPKALAGVPSAGINALLGLLGINEAKNLLGK